MDYPALKAFASQVIHEANSLNIPYKIYWYSPQTRKLNPKNKIGYYDQQPPNVTFEHGCKYVIVFPRLAFHTLETLINHNLPQGKIVRNREDYKSQDDIGFDVYQRVEELKLFIEPDNLSSVRITEEGMLKRDDYWYERQLKALEEVNPPLSSHQITQELNNVVIGFNKALTYLQAQNNPQAKIRVRRNSGFRHRMIRVLPIMETKREGFSDLVLVFGTSTLRLPTVVLPKPPKADRKPRNDSKAAQYKANPSSFKYYDKFGIFEVYDK